MYEFKLVVGRRDSTLLRSAAVVGCMLIVAGCGAAPKSSRLGVTLSESRASECRKFSRPRHTSTEWGEFETSREVRVPLRAIRPIRYASRVTGIDPDYLALTAARESNFRMSVKAQTSSAQGMFQFVQQTWLGTVARYGHCHGLGHLSRHIVVRADGKHDVRSKYMKRKILNLRNNPTIAAVMAGRLTQGNGEGFRRLTGYSPSQGELYITHFLGVRSAAKLARLARKSPHAKANRYFRAAARANPRIFYVNGRPRSVREVFHALVKKHSRVRVVYARGSAAVGARAGRGSIIKRLWQPRRWWRGLKRVYS